MGTLIVGNYKALGRRWEIEKGVRRSGGGVWGGGQLHR
jgi:hypothetical protein